MPSPPSHTTQTTEVKLPAWVEQASLTNYLDAKKVAERPFAQYNGQEIAAPDPLINKAINLFNSSTGDASGLLKKASLGIPGMNRAAYTNPFDEEVLNRSMADLGRSRDMELNDNASSAIKSKAFGGSRAAIIDAITRSETARSAGDLSARLRSEGFDKATNMMTSDLNRMPGIAAGIDDARMKNLGGLVSLGDKRQGFEQERLDRLKRRWQEARDYPLEGVNLKLSALGMSPYGKTENVEKTEKTGTDFASIGGGILSLLPALFMLSDRTTKTDIEDAGSDPTTGLPFYKYRYKGQSPDSPKITGPMAQDVQKLFPERVRRVHGKLAVQLS